MEILPSVLPSNYARDSDDLTSISASSSSSIDAVKDSTATPSLNDHDDDEEDEDVCRICRNPGDNENPLRFPCACRGSIKYVHQDCLLQWLNHSNARQCEVCKHPFAFSPVYAENAPTKLPFQEFIIAMAKKTFHIIHFLLRLSCVLSVWFLIIPYMSYLVYRLTFVRSFNEVQTLFLSHIYTTNILTDCLFGFLVSATITCLYLGATFLRNHLRNFLEHGRQNVQRNNINLNDDVAFDDFRNRMIQRIDHLEAQIDQIIDGLDDVPLMAEIIGLQGPIFPFIQFVFTVIANNLRGIGIAIFVPFSLGRVIIHYMFFTSSSNFATLGVGYMFILSLNFLYHGIVELIRYTRGESLIIRKLHFNFHVFASVLETIKSLFRHFVSGIKHLKTMLKFTFLPFTYFGIFPLLCGWWLDFCTIGMFQSSFDQRIDFFTVSPFSSSFIHWLVGLSYVALIGMILRLLPKVVRFFGQTDTEYEKTWNELSYESVFKQACIVFNSFALCGCLIVMLVFLPVKLATWIAPSIFPLEISVSDALTNILLFQICIPFCIKHIDLRTIITSFVHYWVMIIGSALGLTEFLLPIPEGHIDQEKQVVRNIVVRIVVLIVLAWITLLVFNTSLIVLPVLLGRALYTLISHLPIINGIKFDDIYAFIFGSYVIWAIVAGVRYCIEHILWKNICKWGLIVIKSSTLLSIRILVIPVLIGLLVELLVIVPMRVPLNETPVFVLYEEWTLGFIILKLGTTLMIQEEQMIHLVFPILKELLTAVCVPYVLARGVFPVFGFSLMINSMVYRFAWLGCVGLGLVWYCGKRFYVWFVKLRNSIRDDRYLIGRRLDNFGEQQTLPESVAGEVSPG